ncbi:hypothetical protein AFCDBAGC_4798 [Methylobacterium cerastii]|uniref:Guanylate cyclase domain-containing protein n=1 Tax=Methylobacterium cerastii TaxID=932741 RepID=A0ABQ4QNR6_9HYPH|nr:adenylate/guanylate cyclase domain-containing protein [Methylobacterium cerastii]GJD46913.1 hypothetical protein AFCDBAGC_4798 [Methylobacterium cerastii]
MSEPLIRSPRTLKRWTAPCFAGAGAIVALLMLAAALPAPFARLENFAADTMQRLSPREPSAAPVVVVDIDEESLSRHGQWPWPRTVVADLVTALQDLGASAIALDMVFAEPDRTSPSRLIPEWAQRFGFQASAMPSPLPNHDAVLAEAFARGRVVAGLAPIDDVRVGLPERVAAFAVIGSANFEQIPHFKGAVVNVPVLDAAADGHGSFSIKAGTDEITRRLPMLAFVGGRLVPSLALEALRVLQDEDTFKVRAERVGETLTGYTVRVGDIDVPLDADGSLRLRFPAPRSSRTVSAWRLLDSDHRAELRDEVKGAAVFVGTSAVGLSDLRPTPMTPFEPGVDLHAIALEQALTGKHLVRPVWASGAERSVALLLGLAVALAGALAPFGVSALMAASTIVVPSLIAWAAFTRADLLFDPTLPSLSVALGFAGAILVRYAGTERASRRLRAAFTHYLSPDLVAALANDPGRLKLGGESREMTFLFTDLEGFTAMTEAAGAEALVQLLNDYLDGMCSIAMEHGGTVDKIVGDAVHVMFNAPLDQPDHPERAVRCALALDSFAEAFKLRQRAAGIAFGITRIGVNTGMAVVGNFGGSRRFDYTAHGDAINTAARLEAANKTLGTRICIARATVERVSTHVFRPVGTLMLKGKSVGVDVFEPATQPTGALANYLDAFGRMVAGDAGALQDLLSLHAADPNDPILALHARRIRAGECDALMAA